MWKYVKNNFCFGRKTILFLFLLIALLGMIVFLLPMRKGIINIGNLSGFFACLCAFLILNFFQKFEKAVKLIWDKPVGRIILLFVSILIIAGIIMVSIFSVLMLKGMGNYPKEPNVVVVLGCKVKGTTPSLMLRERLDCAEEYLSKNPEVFCVVTGGQGENEDIPEALAMKDYLLEKGVEEYRILVEDKSTSTFENLKFTKDILLKNDLGTDITIVTDGFHQYRASLIAKECGLQSNGISVKTKTYLIPTYWVREWFGIVKEIVF